MVKTPKVSPLSNRGVRARRVPPVKIAQASHPGGVPEQRATRYAWRWGTLPECDYSLYQSGGIRFAQTTRLPSGDAFSVIPRVKFLRQ